MKFGICKLLTKHINLNKVAHLWLELSKLIELGSSLLELVHIVRAKKKVFECYYVIRNFMNYWQVCEAIPNFRSWAQNAMNNNLSDHYVIVSIYRIPKMSPETSVLVSESHYTCDRGSLKKYCNFRHKIFVRSSLLFKWLSWFKS